MVGYFVQIAIITDRLVKELELDKIFSNKLIFNNNKLEGVDITVTSDKSLSVKSFIDENGFTKDEVVVVVDGANDLTFQSVFFYCWILSC